MIVPPLCARCGTPTVWPVSRCRECAGRRLSFATARAAVEYDDAVRRLVGGWKERGLRRLAGEAAALVIDVDERPDVVALTFVPPDGDRRLTRGHTPARAAAPDGRRAVRPLELGLERRRERVERPGLDVERVVDDQCPVGEHDELELADAELGRFRRHDGIPLARARNAVDADLAPAWRRVMRRPLVRLKTGFSREPDVQGLAPEKTQVGSITP